MKIITVFIVAIFFSFFLYYSGVQAGAQEMYIHQFALRAQESKAALEYHSRDVGESLYFHDSVITNSLVEYGKYEESFKIPVVGLGDIGSMTKDLFESIAAYRKENPVTLNGAQTPFSGVAPLSEDIKLYDQLPEGYKDNIKDRKRLYDNAMRSLTSDENLTYE